MSEESASVVQTISALNSILDRIDTNNSKPSKVPRISQSASRNNETPNSNGNNESLTSQTTTAASISEKETPSIKWMEYFDTTSMKNYYYNIETKETTWEKPALFIPFSRVSYNSSNSISSDEYRFTGTFNRQNGRFSSLPSHLFTENGQMKDRSLRQLSHYMDINELEKNREYAKAAKQEAKSRPPPNGAESWKEYNKERKEEKKRKLYDSLLS